MRFAATPSDSTEIIYDLAFQVVGIDAEALDRFLQLAKTPVEHAMERISDTIKDVSRGMLNRQFGRNVLEFQTVEGRIQLQEFLTYGIDDAENRGVCKTVSRTYGVVVELNSFARESSLPELTDTEITKQRLDQRIKSVEVIGEAEIGELKGLLDQRVESLANPATDPDDLAQLDQRINAVKDNIGVNTKSSGGVSQEYPVARLPNSNVDGRNTLQDLSSKIRSRKPKLRELIDGKPMPDAIGNGGPANAAASSNGELRPEPEEEFDVVDGKVDARSVASPPIDNEPIEAEFRNATDQA